MTSPHDQRETDFCRVEVIDGVLIYTYFDGAVVGLEQARESVRVGSEMVKGPVPALIRTGKTKKLSRGAREFFAEGPENSGLVSAAAITVGSPVTRIMANFFLGLSRPRFPLRVFDAEENALAWLETFKRAQEAHESGEHG